jgi:hypothetical protein
MSLKRFYFMAPKDMQTLYAAVTGPAESTYSEAWLTDGLPGKPLRALDGSPAWSVSGLPKDVNGVAIINHNLDAALEAEVTGDALATLVVPPYHGEYYPVNPFALTTPTVEDVEDLTLTIAGNSQIVVLGQFVAGLFREVDLFEQGGPVEPVSFNKQPDSQMGNIAVHDMQKAARKINGTARVNPAGSDAIFDWYWSTRDGVRFGLIVPDSTLNDVWAVKFAAMPQRTIKGGLHSVTLSFVEIPRKVWSAPFVAT